MKPIPFLFTASISVVAFKSNATKERTAAKITTDSKTLGFKYNGKNNYTNTTSDNHFINYTIYTLNFNTEESLQKVTS